MAVETVVNVDLDMECFENLDRAVHIEMRPQGLPGGLMSQMYAIARGDGAPISYRAAVALHDPAVRRVACVTGIAGDPLPYGEMDGPIGAAAVAEAMCRIGRQADVLVPAILVPVLEGIKRAMNGQFGVLDDRDARPDDYDAAVSVEKLGRNAKGVAHNIFGHPREGQEPVADDFIEALNAAGKVTIGMGDGGNEVGFGAVYDRAREIIPFGAECQCPCGDGMVTSTATKILFPVAVSNFGAYAIVAGLGILESRPLLLVSPETIRSATEAASGYGCLDGGTYQPGRLGDDGIPMWGVMAVVNLLRCIAFQHFATTPRHA